jgi:hypothetical protein
MIRLDQPKWLWVVSMISLLLGAFLVAASHRTEQWASELPRMTCAELVRQEARSPRFVVLTDVQLGQSGHAFRRDMDAAIAMYIPVFSTTLKKQPPAADLSLLLEVLADRDRQRLLENPKVGELTVELWTDAANLDPWIDLELSARYPGLQIGNCRVVSVGLHEPTLVRAQRERQQGIALLFLPIVCPPSWWIWRYLRRPVRRVKVASIAR